MDRRTFVMTSGAAGLRAAAAEQVRVGIVGAGGRGRLLAAEFKEAGALVPAVCDVYDPNLQAGLKAASTGATPYTDYRRLLEDPNINAVVIATPDHWHARMLIDAVEAGKDVFVEKPLCHTIPEGFDIVSAVRRTKRVVQVGTQRRSSPFFQQAREIARSGVLGEVRFVTSLWLNHQTRLSAARLSGALDWKRWLGPAPAREEDAQRFFNWYHFWDYSGGMLVGQAAHIVDAIQWFLDAQAPHAVTCAAPRPNLEGAEVPDTANLSIEFPGNVLATFAISYKAMRYHFSEDQLMQFHGDKARFDVGREAWRLWPESRTPQPKPSKEEIRLGSFIPATRDHIRNFLECVRTRAEPTAPVEAGLATAIVLRMAVDSLRSGRRLVWNPAKRAVEG
jgi:predicted dehydrogenase